MSLHTVKAWIPGPVDTHITEVALDHVDHCWFIPTGEEDLVVDPVYYEVYCCLVAIQCLIGWSTELPSSEWYPRLIGTP